MEVTTKTRVFLDRKAVSDALGKVNAGILLRAGMLVRRSARQSMRRRKKPSAPGTPPSAHSGPNYPRGPLLKTLMEASFDTATKSLVVGPKGKQGLAAPSLQEFGGVIRTRVLAPKKNGRMLSPAQKAAFQRKVKDGSIVRTKADRREVSVKLPARPYMAPALARDLPKFPSLYANTVKP